MSLNLNKKNIIWDLDNTLYRITPEFADALDETMATVVVEDFDLGLDLETAKEMVKQSYRDHRDGGEVFFKTYNIDTKKFYESYFRRKPIEMIEPFEGFAEKIKQLPYNQYIFTASNHYAAEKILRKIGLYDFFKGRICSFEDFNYAKKNASSEIYTKLCEKFSIDPKDTVFVDDSYSNLEFPKELGMITIRIFYQENSAKDKPYIDYAFKGAPALVAEFI